VLTDFANSIMQLRYSHPKTGGSFETWEEIASRVVDSVFFVAPSISKDIRDAIKLIISERKFIPGGRFLAQAGREYHQVNNCYLLRAEDSREGWGDLASKSTVMLMSGGGIGIDYSRIRERGAKLKRSGGESSGPLPLMNVINEIGRGVMSGGKRRSAIWAGLNWAHPDILDFIEMKNWSPDVRKLKEKDFDFPAAMDMTNISVILTKDFFEAFEDENNPKYSQAQQIYWRVINRMVKTGEPGFSVDYSNREESLRNACFTGDMRILTPNGYVSLENLFKLGEQELVDALGNKVLGVVRKTGNKPVVILNLSTNKKIRCTEDHLFRDTSGNEIKAGNAKGTQLMPYLRYPVLDGYYTLLGFIQGDGDLGRLKSDQHRGVEVNIGAKDSDILKLLEGRKYTTGKRSIYLQDIKEDLLALGFDNKKLPEREFPSNIETWDTNKLASFLRGCFSANGTINNYGRICYKATSIRFIKQLQELLEDSFSISSYVTTNKSHEVVFKNGTYTVKESYDLNISDFESRTNFYNKINFYQLYKVEKLTELLTKGAPFVKSITPTFNEDVYDFTLPEYHWGVVEGVVAHNCTEVVSSEDSDVCCLGSLNLGRISTIEELSWVTDLATLFLLVGTEYSDVPTSKAKEVQRRQRRLGLGLMGMHEWMVLRGKPYGESEELASWLATWKSTSDLSARKWAGQLSYNTPVAIRAIAPNGSTAIAGGMTTSGIEPIFSTAYQRRYLTPDGWKKQYVVDFVAERLVEQGINPNDIEDAYSLSLDVERRVAFQSFVQKYVDNSISSTVNLPAFGTVGNDNPEYFGKILYKYLPQLRGITAYPDGARGGQPLTQVDFEYARQRKGVIFEANEDCVGGVCGI